MFGQQRNSTGQALFSPPQTIENHGVQDLPKHETFRKEERYAVSNDNVIKLI